MQMVLEGCIRLGGSELAQAAVTFLPLPIHWNELAEADSKAILKDVQDDVTKEIDARPSQNGTSRTIESNEREIETTLRAVDNGRERRSEVVARSNDQSQVSILAHEASALNIKRITSSALRKENRALRCTGVRFTAVSLRRGEGFTIVAAAEVLTLKRRDGEIAQSTRNGREAEVGTLIEHEATVDTEVHAGSEHLGGSYNGGGIAKLERSILGAGSRAPGTGEPKVHTVQAVTSITKSRNLPIHIKRNEAALKLLVAPCWLVVVMTITGGVECTYQR